jgi:hypothetical protein
LSKYKNELEALIGDSKDTSGRNLPPRNKANIIKSNTRDTNSVPTNKKVILVNHVGKIILKQNSQYQINNEASLSNNRNTEPNNNSFLDEQNYILDAKTTSKNETMSLFDLPRIKPKPGTSVNAFGDLYHIRPRVNSRYQ